MTLTNLQTKARFLLGNLSSDNFSDTNLNRALNDYYNRAIALAIMSNGQWEVKGEIATTNIVDGQMEYVLPNDLIALKKIEVNLTGDTDGWQVLDVHDLRDLRQITNYQDDSSDDTESETSIDLFDNSIFFRRPPKNNVTNGLKIYFNKEETELSSGTDEPSLPEHLHSYLVYGACMDYSDRIDDNEGSRKWQTKILLLENDIKDYYSNRLPLVRVRLIPRVEKYN